MNRIIHELVTVAAHQAWIKAIARIDHDTADLAWAVYHAMYNHWKGAYQ